MNDFIAINFKTAMYARSGDISIGLVKFRNYQLIETFYSFIRLLKLYIRPDFSDIHGLTVI
ncbi:MAG: hypothetical protein FWG99_05645 [Treponema sp.]|nr:hypothetical protein [Treponema sp.]